MRLFVGEPVWTPYNREDIDELKNASRNKYVDTFLSPLLSNKRQKVEDKDDIATTATVEKEEAKEMSEVAVV